MTPTARFLVPGTSLAVIVTLVAVLAGCGAGTVGAQAGPGEAVRLTIRYDPAEGMPVRTATVRCGRRATTTGYLRTTATRACRAARRLAGFLAAEADPDRQCTEIYGGPQTARIRGTIGARRIDRAFARTDGCLVSDWTMARGLLPPTRGASPPS